jgi:hypothetical protein
VIRTNCDEKSDAVMPVTGTAFAMCYRDNQYFVSQFKEDNQVRKTADSGM